MSVPASTAPNLLMPDRRNPEIDFLRGVAILLVLVAHIGFVAPLGSPWVGYVNTYIAQFWIGVDLFFVISGYVISASLIPKLDSAAHAAPVVRRFYIRRFFRIVPLAAFWATYALCMSCLATTLGWTGHRFGAPDVVARHFAASMLFIENIYLVFELNGILSQYWSLAVEEQFYLLFPLLLVLTRRRGRTLFICLAIAVQALLYRPPRQDVLLSMLRFDALLMGVLIHIWRDQIYARLHPVIMAMKHGPGLCLAGGLLVLACLIPAHIGNWRGAMTVIDLACAGLVVLATLQSGFYIRLVPGLLFRIIHSVGNVSFSLYLAHMPAFYVVSTITVLAQPLGGWRLDSGLTAYGAAAGLVLAALFTALSYRFIEVPTRRYSRRFV
jgi:peptidoglycan/LPS O-acetylase OafA/YrhL